MEMRADLNKDSSDVARMFDEVASRYDITNRVLTFGQVRLWRSVVASEVCREPGVRVLDLACGTGSSTAEFASRGCDVVGCDISGGMITQGKKRHPELDLRQANALDLPFEDEAFDVTTMSYGLRNVEDPEEALAEMYRVTKPGGRIVIAEFSAPEKQPFMFGYKLYITKMLPMLSKLVSSDGLAYDYLYESILEWPSKEELGQMIRGAGWRDVSYASLAFGAVSVHRGQKY